MKSLRALKAAGLILAAVLLGLMTVQGSYALWNTAVTANAGTVQAADFSIKVNGQPMAGTMPALSIGEMKRGTTAYTAIDVMNNVNVTANSPLVIKLTMTGLVPSDNFRGHLVVKTFVPKANVKCASVPAASYTAAPASISSVVTLKSTQSVCIAVELKSTVPVALLGNPINIPVDLTVAQVAPGTK